MKSLLRDYGNLSLLRHRGYDGFIVSMHQSGTHWLKHMLAVALARYYDLPLPARLQDDTIIGHPKSPPIYRKIPQVVHSHNIPSPIVHLRLWRFFLKFPRYVVLVRDPRAALVSNYEKWKSRYAVSFSDYLRGDPEGKRFDKDIWWDIRFMNAWGKAVSRYPNDIIIARYESLTEDTLLELKRVARFLKLDFLDDEILREAIDASTKDKMAKKPNPKQQLSVVRKEQSDYSSWYGEDDRQFLESVFDKYLVHDFGYSFAVWGGEKHPG